MKIRQFAIVYGDTIRWSPSVASSSILLGKLIDTSVLKQPIEEFPFSVYLITISQ